ncbi:DUF4064 domain-containing protein [Virgibacillus salinus]|uniref:DUF4064 domain-containing protein n=1 Tax=Virgibacillus salinus TaxID=553311 RepID=A0A1H1FNR1_9BACI|nr:DUF4064 domain-containing protein [Virgibacillus salinus]SDR02550.1 Protein of unknown function [Virgibacillus salinus]
MNRTGEIVLTIVGALIYMLFAGVGIFAAWLFNNEQVLNEASDEMMQQPGMGTGDMQAMLEVLQGGGLVLAIVSIIALVLGIISIILVKGDKKPKAAGIILIVTSVLAAIITVGAGIFSGIFYLIAGIMCLARKEQQTITVE